MADHSSEAEIDFVGNVRGGQTERTAVALSPLGISSLPGLGARNYMKLQDGTPSGFPDVVDAQYRLYRGVGDCG